ncbi:MAG TPA: transposase [Desulfuromonadaceae bacterium]|jgi:putative transposase
MPRIARAVAIGYPHHITQRGNNRSDVFFDDDDRKFYCDTLIRYSRKYSLEIWSYCLMTNHIHLLAVPRKGESLSRGIGVTNLLYTQYLNRKLGNSGRVWQNRFFSCAVESDIYLWSVVRYIVRNPVKAGLVPAAELYRWSSASAHVCGAFDPIISDTAWLAAEQRDQFGDFLTTPSEEEESLIRKKTTTGRPLGTDLFVDNLEYMIASSLRLKPRGRPKKIVYK